MYVRILPCVSQLAAAQNQSGAESAAFATADGSSDATAAGTALSTRESISINSGSDTRSTSSAQVASLSEQLARAQAMQVAICECDMQLRSTRLYTRSVDKNCAATEWMLAHADLHWSHGLQEYRHSPSPLQYSVPLYTHGHATEEDHELFTFRAECTVSDGVLQ